MNKEYNHYDCLRVEMFEKLMPQMIHRGSREENDDFFNALLHDGENLVHILFEELCIQDKMPYPYEENDFEVHTFSYGAINMIQIGLPAYNSDISDILRAYLLFSEHGEGVVIKKYFVVKRFGDGKVYNLYVTPEPESLRMEELTGYEEDMEYEHGRLVCDYFIVVLQEMALGGQGRS